MFLRRKRSLQIEALDAKKDCREIVYLLTCYEFPWDMERALEFALFRTYAVPSISRLLHKTGEFINRPHKRYDDTELLLSEILENGFDSKRGQAALERINQMHRRFPISNSDYLYVLTTFIYEPIRWIERFGWRQLTKIEELAMFNYYCKLGHYLGIEAIPDDFDEFERYNREYEYTHFRYADTNNRIGAATRDLILSFYMPKLLFPIARPFAHALMDHGLLRAMGFAKSPALLRRFMESALKLRGRSVKWLPDRRHPYLLTKVKRPTYPEGYKIEELGTFRK